MVYILRRYSGQTKIDFSNEKSLKTKNLKITGLEIRSFCSNQMSNCERFAQIAQDKWATVSDSLRSLMINEQIARFFEQITHLLFHSQKTSNLLIHSFLMSDASKSLRLLTKNERSEWFAQVAHQKWANDWITCFFEQIAHSLIIRYSLKQTNKQYVQKTDE